MAETRIKNSLFWLSVVSLFFFSLIMAQMIHHEMTGSVFTFDVSGLSGFMGVWIFFAYLLDVVCFGGLVVFFIRKTKRKEA